MDSDTPKPKSDEAPNQPDTFRRRKVFGGLVVSIIAISLGLLSIVTIAYVFTFLIFDDATSKIVFALLMLLVAIVIYKFFSGYKWARLVLSGVISLIGVFMFVFASSLVVSAFTSASPEAWEMGLLAIMFIPMSVIPLASAAMLAFDGSIRHYQHYVSSKRTNGAKVF